MVFFDLLVFWGLLSAFFFLEMTLFFNGLVLLAGMGCVVFG
jgi:hypothetical protein